MKKFLKIMLSIVFFPYGIYWLYKVKGWKPAAAVFIAILMLNVVMPSQEEKIAKKLEKEAAQGITVDQLKQNTLVEEENRKKYALPSNYKFSSESSKIDHMNAINSGLEIEYVVSREVNRKHSQMIEEGKRTHCFGDNSAMNSFEKQYKQGFNQWNNLHPSVKKSFDNDPQNFSPVGVPMELYRDSAKSLSQCLTKSHASKGYAFIFVDRQS